MKFNKITLAVLAIFSFFAIADISRAENTGATAPTLPGYSENVAPVLEGYVVPVLPETLAPALDKTGKPVLDLRYNCVRTKWPVGQAGDPCNPPPPAPPPAPIVVEKERKIPYVDLVRQSIYFDIDKDNITPIDEQRMQEVMNEINKSIGIRDVKLVGYADRFASDKYDMALSKRRATNVLNYFRDKGFFNNVTVGFGFFGKEKPVTNCPTNVSIAKQIVCLQADRRVDIEVELLREHVEKYQETIQPPAYPRAGTEDVEVYSRPINPNSIQFNNAGDGTMNNATLNNAPPAGVAAPVTPVQSIDVLKHN